jgi:hypothetical protein
VGPLKRKSKAGKADAVREIRVVKRYCNDREPR